MTEEKTNEGAAFNVRALSLKELVETQNEMVHTAADLRIVTPFLKPVKSYRSLPDGQRAVFRLHAAIMAAREGKLERANEIMGTDWKRVLELVPELVEAREATKTSPGLRRLRADPRAETTRKAVVADNEKALAAAKDEREATEKPTSTVKESKVTKTAAKKKAKTERPPRSSGINVEGKIEVVDAVNPRREGTQAHKDQQHIRNGMLVETFISKIGDRVRAVGLLRDSVRRGIIKIV